MFRFSEEINVRNYKEAGRIESIDTYWDNDYDLADVGGWELRHRHEANILVKIINQYKISKVLELGSGPGNLATKVIDKTGILYDLVDGESAKRAYTRRNYKGRFFVKDLFDSFDSTGLSEDYDLVVANDFLEHIRNPSLILETVRKLTTSTSYFFLSSPNWRMKHMYYYPGLFDYDNLVKFMWQEGYDPINIYDSWAQHVPIKLARLDSENSVPEGHLLDWNYYLLFKKM